MVTTRNGPEIWGLAEEAMKKKLSTGIPPSCAVMLATGSLPLCTVFRRFARWKWEMHAGSFHSQPATPKLTWCMLAQFSVAPLCVNCAFRVRAD